VEWPDAVYDKVGNILLSRIMGADVRLDPAGFDIGFRPSWEQALADVEARGGKPYAVGRIRPPARRARLRALGLRARGAGTRARRVLRHDRRLLGDGLDAGGDDRRLAGQERPRRVLGIDGSATVEQTRDQIMRIARRTAEAIRLGRELREDEIVLLDEWHAGTYGIPDAKTIDAIRLCARLEGVLTDPVYEGKSMAALTDLVRSKRIEPGSHVPYAHLGGQPALNAYAGAF
jgi:1-aminocyclopropane-1-carboxylate deaminase